ncbi:MAG: hypothetical protein CL912_20575 [Deltaproteobacteria bacterium]|nr:hypothetical protein [Deltaproteobacteria bacterium]
MESLSNGSIDHGKSAHPLIYHEQSDHHEELSQQPHGHINSGSPLPDIDGLALPQPSLDWEELDPKTIISRMMIGARNRHHPGVR